MNNRKMKFALVATIPGEGTRVIAKAATREKLEKKRAALAALTTYPLNVTELETMPREPRKVGNKLEEILNKMRELTPGELETGADARLIAAALGLLAGRHRDVVGRLVDAWVGLGVDAR